MIPKYHFRQKEQQHKAGVLQKYLELYLGNNLEDKVQFTIKLLKIFKEARGGQNFVRILKCILWHPSTRM